MKSNGSKETLLVSTECLQSNHLKTSPPYVRHTGEGTKKHFIHNSKIEAATRLINNI